MAQTTIRSAHNNPSALVALFSRVRETNPGWSADFEDSNLDDPEQARVLLATAPSWEAGLLTFATIEYRREFKMDYLSRISRGVR